MLDLENINSSTPMSVDDIIANKMSGGKKKSRKSILDTGDIQQIIVPKPIVQQIETEMLATVSASNEVTQVQLAMQARKSDPESTPEAIDALPEEVLEEMNIERSEELDLIRETPIPENINIIKVEAQLNDAVRNIPDGGTIDISNIRILASKTATDKSGYFKTKCIMGMDKFPDIIREISSQVKTLSDGLIPWRETDTRVIANTNKTQLNGSTLKLHAATVGYKPDHTRLKVNKSTRIMLSVPANFTSTGNLLVYMQESRDKSIHEISPKDFSSHEQYVTFIVKLIVDYYKSGYDVSLKKLKFRSSEENAPIIAALAVVSRSGEFKVKTKTEDDRLIAAEFTSKDPEVPVYIKLQLTKQPDGKYKMTAMNTAIGGEALIDSNIDEFKITGDKLYSVLVKLFANDWGKIFGASEDDKLHYLMGKLTHKKLKLALTALDQYINEENLSGLVVAETLSKAQASKRLDESYDAECIIGKTNDNDYFILSYLAVPIAAGDARTPQQYITNDDYYKKYDVSDKRQYAARSKIMHMQGAARKYNARKYRFQLEVKSGKSLSKYTAETMLDILAQSNLLE